MKKKYWKSQGILSEEKSGNPGKRFLWNPSGGGGVVSCRQDKEYFPPPPRQDRGYHPAPAPPPLPRYRRTDCVAGGTPLAVHAGGLSCFRVKSLSHKLNDKQ